MIRLDREMLDELGLSRLTDADKDALLENILLSQISELLKSRVDNWFAENLTDQQLNEIESFEKTGDESGLSDYMQRNFPNHEEMVERQFIDIQTAVSQMFAKASKVE